MKCEERYKYEQSPFRYETPMSAKFKTLPSTQPQSTPQSQSADFDLPRLQIDEERLEKLKQKLDWQLKLSKIKHAEGPVQEGWQSFEGDSMEDLNQEIL